MAEAKNTKNESPSKPVEAAPLTTPCSPVHDEPTTDSHHDADFSAEESKEDAA
jgi:hypothetical protein